MISSRVVVFLSSIIVCSIFFQTQAFAGAVVSPLPLKPSIISPSGGAIVSVGDTFKGSVAKTKDNVAFNFVKAEWLIASIYGGVDFILGNDQGAFTHQTDGTYDEYNLPFNMNLLDAVVVKIKVNQLGHVLLLDASGVEKGRVQLDFLQNATLNFKNADAYKALRVWKLSSPNALVIQWHISATAPSTLNTKVQVVLLPSGEFRVHFSPELFNNTALMTGFGASTVSLFGVPDNGGKLSLSDIYGAASTKYFGVSCNVNELLPPPATAGSKNIDCKRALFSSGFKVLDEPAFSVEGTFDTTQVQGLYPGNLGEFRGRDYKAFVRYKVGQAGTPVYAAYSNWSKPVTYTRPPLDTKYLITDIVKPKFVVGEDISFSFKVKNSGTEKNKNLIFKLSGDSGNLDHISVDVNGKFCWSSSIKPISFDNTCVLVESTLPSENLIKVTYRLSSSNPASFKAKLCDSSLCLSTILEQTFEVSTTSTASSGGGGGGGGGGSMAYALLLTLTVLIFRLFALPNMLRRKVSD